MQVYNTLKPGIYYKIDDTVEYPADTTVNICIKPQKKGIQVDIVNPALYTAASVNPKSTTHIISNTNDSTTYQGNEFSRKDVDDRNQHRPFGFEEVDTPRP